MKRDRRRLKSFKKNRHRTPSLVLQVAEGDGGFLTDLGYWVFEPLN